MSQNIYASDRKTFEREIQDLELTTLYALGYFGYWFWGI